MLLPTSHPPLRRAIQGSGLLLGPRVVIEAATCQYALGAVRRGTALNDESLILTAKADRDIDLETGNLGEDIRSIPHKPAP